MSCPDGVVHELTGVGQELDRSWPGVGQHPFSAITIQNKNPCRMDRIFFASNVACSRL